MSQITRAFGLQEVPEPFAEQLRQMLADRDVRLNTVLREARALGWHTQTLAHVLGLPEAATGKRIERATPEDWGTHVRETARVLLRDLGKRVDLTDPQHAGLADDLNYLLEVRLSRGTTTKRDIRWVARRAAKELARLAEAAEKTDGGARAAKSLRTLHDRLLRALAYDPKSVPRVRVEARPAEVKWLRNMAQVATEVHADLAGLPDFLTEDPQLRVTVTESLLELQEMPLRRAMSPVQVRELSAQVRNGMRAMKQGIDRDFPERARVIRALTRLATKLRAAEEHQPDGVRVGGVKIPPPPRQQTTLRGDHLSDEEIEQLRGMQALASQVNGATRLDSPEWRVSEQLSARLLELVRPSDPDVSPIPAYYLARVLGVTHRAIITRLDRYQARRLAQGTPGRESTVRFQVSA